MDRLIQMGKDLVYEGEELQDFVKQQQDKERELERDRIAAEEAKADKEREFERDGIAAQEKERADKRKKKIGKSS